MSEDELTEEDDTILEIDVGSPTFNAIHETIMTEYVKNPEETHVNLFTLLEQFFNECIVTDLHEDLEMGTDTKNTIVSLLNHLLDRIVMLHLNPAVVKSDIDQWFRTIDKPTKKALNKLTKKIKKKE